VTGVDGDDEESARAIATGSPVGAVVVEHDPLDRDFLPGFRAGVSGPDWPVRHRLLRHVDHHPVGHPSTAEDSARSIRRASGDRTHLCTPGERLTRTLRTTPPAMSVSRTSEAASTPRRSTAIRSGFVHDRISQRPARRSNTTRVRPARRCARSSSAPSVSTNSKPRGSRTERENASGNDDPHSPENERSRHTSCGRSCLTVAGDHPCARVLGHEVSAVRFDEVSGVRQE